MSYLDNCSYLWTWGHFICSLPIYWPEYFMWSLTYPLTRTFCEILAYPLVSIFYVILAYPLARIFHVILYILSLYDGTVIIIYFIFLYQSGPKWGVGVEGISNSVFFKKWKNDLSDWQCWVGLYIEIPFICCSLWVLLTLHSWISPVHILQQQNMLIDICK